MRYYALVKVRVDVDFNRSNHKIEVLAVSSDKRKLRKILQLEIDTRGDSYCCENNWLTDDEESYHLYNLEIIEITGFKNENVAKVFSKKK